MKWIDIGVDDGVGVVGPCYSEVLYYLLKDRNLST